MNATVSGLVFAAVMVLAMALRARRAPRVGSLLGRPAPLLAVTAQAERPATRRYFRLSAPGRASSMPLFDQALRWLEARMLQAAVYLPLPNILMLIAALTVGAITCALLLDASWLIAAAAGIACGSSPLLYVELRRRSRLARFSQQLPEVLDMLKSSLQAGHSLHRGLQVVADEFGDPVGGEVRIMLEQAHLGMAVPRALEEMQRRIPDASLNLLVVAVKIQAEVGSSLADIIGRLGQTIRDRHRIRLQIKALTAQPRMSGMILGLLPFIVLGFFLVIQPNYTMVLFRDPLGIKIFKTAIALDLIAFVVIRRILRSDF